MFLNFRALVQEEIKDDWLIALNLGFNYQLKFVNIKNPHYKQIINLINLSIEHGVILKRDRLLKNGYLLLYYLAEKFAPQEMIDTINRLISKRRIEITINELESLFLLLTIGLSLSICSLIIEIISNKFSK